MDVESGFLMAMTSDLFPYQESGVDLITDRGHGLIAFTMGLGKTVTALACVEEYLATPDINFAMIVVPSGLKYQWASSIAKFTDVDSVEVKFRNRVLTLPTEQWCVVVDGDKKTRDAKYQYIEENWPNYVIVTYDQVVNDWKWIKRLAPEMVVIDEASYIKGFKAQRSKRIKDLGDQALYRIALTGTPIENRLDELYSVMEFVDPDFLGSFTSFEKKYIVRGRYGEIARYRNLDLLNEKLQDVMIRKTRHDPDVAPYMPDVDYRVEYVVLSDSTQKLYDRIAREVVTELRDRPNNATFDMTAYYSGQDNQDMSATGRIMAKMLALQMLCDHPQLLHHSAQAYEDGTGGSKFIYKLRESGALEGIKETEKLNQLVTDIHRILGFEPDAKVIIFSFFKEMGRIIQEALPEYPSVIYNGDMSASEKSAAQATFKTDSDCRLFIASDAGAFGVDLPEAKYLFNYDEVDSAGKMDQRNSRHVRAGSDHDNVYVISYIVDGTAEEHRHARLDFKRRTAMGAIDGQIRRSNTGELENDVEGLASFLDERLPVE